jgi:ribosome-binding protein aMBF1 (putative translation factor)
MPRTYGKGSQIVVIENVPVVVCPDCGESYMTAETLRQIERLKVHRRHVKARRRAPVITYA